MEEVKLYKRYNRHEAIALFESAAKARSLCDGQWVIFPDVVLCFADIGEPPRKSHFSNGGEFCWVAEKPYQVGDDPNFGFVPREVVKGPANSPIHLFVRNIGPERYLHVGRLAPACRFTLCGLGNEGEAYFQLTLALPSEVWSEIGGFDPGDLDHQAADDVLDRLHAPTVVGERLEILRGVVEYWHGPIGPEDGIPEEELDGLRMPDPLRWWYRWAGRRRKIMCGQNFLVDPGKLAVRDGLLEFYVENQYCYQWGALIEGDDPPVFGRAETTDQWEPEGITLSEHLILACLFEAIMCHSPYGASTSWLDESSLAQIIEHAPPISVNAWHWASGTRFYAKGGAFMVTMPNGEIDGKQGYSVWVGAKTERPLQFLKPYIDKDWEYVAV